ncbi:hypothetical protein LIER_26975 [Lithospermum erythrorhizon]|uniref:RING-type E3 ubiquitin transferase n=1 Tax=Lithospermum erythrorhizon TaxID=34254 RepID=A0AAV3RG67_LITER
MMRPCQAALRWALETVCKKGEKILLIHVKLRPPGTSPPPPPRLNEISKQRNAFDQLDAQTRDFLLHFRVFCTRKDIDTQEVVLEDVDIANPLIEFVKMTTIEVLILGAAGKGYLFRLKLKDVPGSILKGVLCISYPKESRSNASYESFCSGNSRGSPRPIMGSPRPMYECTPPRYGDSTAMKSPFTYRKGPNGKPHEYSPAPESDITFVSSGRPSVDSLFPTFSDNFDDPLQRLSGFSELDTKKFASMNLDRRSVDSMTHSDLSSYPSHNNNSFMSQTMEDENSEMQRLKQELKQMMDMYSSSRKEAISAKQKALELQNWKMEEQKKLEQAKLSEKYAHVLFEQEKAKCRAAIEHAETARRRAELESQKRVDSEIKALKEVEERDMVLNKFSTSALGYRRYTTEEIEVLRPDAAQGISEFQHEVGILSCIRHPNMVLLLGACLEYGCLVYEYMSCGSLEDHLIHRGKSPPLPWQHRFRIAAEITTGLLFLHHSKPQPIVHCGLKLKNILLDRNLVTKISDVGLAKIVPPSVADTVTEHRMTSTAGNFCYMDPEYQQTGMLNVKSDVYSLGILFLQILTSRPPMGLAHCIRKGIESGALDQMLDPAVPDWPVEDSLCLAKLALQCCELRSEDRPDLGKVLLPVAVEGYQCPK